MKVRLPAVPLGLLLALAIAPPAGAETTTIGKVAPSGSAGSCIACTDFQLGTAANSPSYAVPAGNWRRLVAWRIRGGAEQRGHAALRIFRPTATPDRYRLVNQAAEETVPAKRASKFRTSVAVERGDLLGLRTGNVPGDIELSHESASLDDQVGNVLGDPKIGDTAGVGGDYDFVFDSPALMNVSATLYRSPPETTITKHPPAETGSRRARLEFRADAPRPDFRCTLDGARRFKGCSSPRRYKHLSRGRHVFEVKAVDAHGHVDPSPAEWSWRISG